MCSRAHAGACKCGVGLEHGAGSATMSPRPPPPVTPSLPHTGPHGQARDGADMDTHRRPGSYWNKLEEPPVARGGWRSWTCDRKTKRPPPSKDARLSERPHLCPGSHGEPATVSKQRDGMTRAVFKAHLSHHSLLNEPGKGEAQRECSKLATEPFQVEICT